MKLRVLSLAAVLSLAYAGAANAVVFGGVDFPMGDISFADVVASYQPGLAGASPTLPFQGPENALGAPDFGSPNCTMISDCTFVSLGVGGALTLQFTDNLLTGSNSAAADLYVFEIGRDVEATNVEVSSNGVDWFSVGSVGGGTAGVDLDAFGFGSSASFQFVRLTDIADQGRTFGRTVGADIDAVGAVSTRAVVVPEPATWAMMILGFGTAGGLLRRRRALSPA